MAGFDLEVTDRLPGVRWRTGVALLAVPLVFLLLVNPIPLASQGAIRVHRGAGGVPVVPVVKIPVHVPPTHLAPSSCTGSGAPIGVGCRLASPRTLNCPPTTPALWTNATCAYASGPSARYGAAFAADVPDGYALLFGGRGAAGLLSDTWVYTNHSWQNLTPTLSRAPPERSGASLAYDFTRGYFVLFGGSGTTQTYGDTWEFRNGTWTNVTLWSTFAPGPRTGASMTFDRKTDYVVMFGGRIGGFTLSETWKFVAGNWTHLFPGVHPPARSNATATYVNGVFTPGGVLLFGGRNASGIMLNDTWEYQAGAWNNVTASVGAAPSARENAAAADDVLDNQVILYGGDGPGHPASADTWRFGSTGWSQVAATSPVPSLTAAGMVYLSTSTRVATDGYTLLVGGRALGVTPSSTCWKFGVLTLNASIKSADVGQLDNGSSQALRGVAPYQYHWSFGDGNGVSQAAVNHTFGSPGPFLVNVSATDQLGVTTVVSLPLTIAPILLLNATGNRSQTDVGLPVSLTARATGGAGSYRFNWNLSQGNASSNASLAPTFRTAGLVRAVARVTDANNFTVSQTVNVNVHPALQAAALLSAAGVVNVGQNVAFVANITGGTTPFHASWSVDGTNVSSGLGLNYTFPFTGPHVIGLYVRDLVGGAANAVLNVTVGTGSSAPPPKSGFWSTTHIAEAGVGLFVVLVIIAVLVVRSRRKSVPPRPPGARPASSGARQGPPGSGTGTRPAAGPPRAGSGPGGARGDPSPRPPPIQPARTGTGALRSPPPTRPPLANPARTFGVAAMPPPTSTPRANPTAPRNGPSRGPGPSTGPPRVAPISADATRPAPHSPLPPLPRTAAVLASRPPSIPGATAGDSPPSAPGPAPGLNPLRRPKLPSS